MIETVTVTEPAIACTKLVYAFGSTKAVDGIEFVCLGEIHSEEAAADRVPEGRMAAFVHDPPKLGEDGIAEPSPVRLHEEVARSSEQQPEPAGPLVRVEEQPADLARAFEIGGQIEQLVAEGLRKLRALLGEG